MWTQLKYHPIQRAVWTDPHRFKIVCAGRGSGKSEIARRFIVRQLPIRKAWTDPMYAYALPTYGQARRVAWKPILKLIPPSWIKGKPKESSMVIETVFGSTLHIVGLDQPARIEGNQWDGIIEDECSDQPPNAFNLSIRPALTHRSGFGWRIGVPKRFGIGAHAFKDAFDMGLEPSETTKSYHWSSEDILDPREILELKAAHSTVDYDEQYRASWKTITGLVYHSFDPIFNVLDEVTYRPNQPIIVGQDFNVDPMSWCLCHVAANGLTVFDEIRIRNTNTQATMDELFRRYGQHASGWIFIGDASGQARKTSASATDYAIIANDKRFINKSMRYSTSNPPTADRVASVNALLCDANNTRRLFIHPRCKALIKDLETQSYKQFTREIQPARDIGHMIDALGYIVYAAFPLRIYEEPMTNSMVSHAY